MNAPTETTFHNRLRLILLCGLFLRDWVFHDCSRVISEKTWTTRKALQSLFLSLYFWHKPIKLQHRKMRGRWSQNQPIPNQDTWFYTAAGGRTFHFPYFHLCLDCSSPLISRRWGLLQSNATTFLPPSDLILMSGLLLGGRNSRWDPHATNYWWRCMSVS